MTIIVSETNLNENTPIYSLKTKQDKAARQANINEDKDSVWSVIDDVDALLKSADPLPVPQQAEAVFNKISGPRNKNYPGLISMLQGSQKCIAWNPSN